MFPRLPCTAKGKLIPRSFSFETKGGVPLEQHVAQHDTHIPGLHWHGKPSICSGVRFKGTPPKPGSRTQCSPTKSPKRVESPNWGAFPWMVLKKIRQQGNQPLVARPIRSLPPMSFKSSPVKHLSSGPGAPGNSTGPRPNVAPPLPNKELTVDQMAHGIFCGDLSSKTLKAT